jgi:putative ABC transport system ATP-binding protein
VTAALTGVSLDVEAREMLVIRGHSGSGKSTLLHVLAGLAVADEGEIQFQSFPLHKLDEAARAIVRRRHIGFVYQAFQLVETMTALENVALPLLFGGVEKREREQRSARALEELGLADRRQRFPYELSGGEQQRVAIARALVTEPSVILADEPTGSLDTVAAGKVLDAIARVHESKAMTTILVTHDDAVAKRMATRTIELRDGRVVR